MRQVGQLPRTLNLDFIVSLQNKMFGFSGIIPFRLDHFNNEICNKIISFGGISISSQIRNIYLNYHALRCDACF